MMRETSFSDVEFASKNKLTRRERFLPEIEATTPWPALVAALLPYYPKGDGPGRAPIGMERMLRMYIAQQCLGLSDGLIEDAIYDIGSFPQHPAPISTKNLQTKIAPIFYSDSGKK